MMTEFRIIISSGKAYGVGGGLREPSVVLK